MNYPHATPCPTLQVPGKHSMDRLPINHESIQRMALYTTQSMWIRHDSMQAIWGSAQRSISSQYRTNRFYDIIHSSLAPMLLDHFYIFAQGNVISSSFLLPFLHFFRHAMKMAEAIT